jgi:hypothetical protein
VAVGRCRDWRWDFYDERGVGMGEALLSRWKGCFRLAAVAVVLLAVACGENNQGERSTAPLLNTSAAAAAPGATPEPVAASGDPVGVPAAQQAVENPTDGPVSTQASSAEGYFPGWSRIDCATYSRRPEAFCEAMKDAEVAKPSDIYTGLTAVTPYNEDLIWSGTRGQSRLLVLTWSSFIDRTSADSGYNPGDGYREGRSLVSARDVFVTIAPELREFCQSNGPFEDVALRLEQLLGLAPQGGQDSQGNHREFVKLWVHPQYLFRPSPDPEITDSQAELDFAQWDRFVKVSQEHVQWFNHFKSMSYEESGLPWTRLGYTYDWGNPDSAVGLSEFVIKQGATVEVHSISPTQEYC